MKQIFIINLLLSSILPFNEIADFLDGSATVIVSLTNLTVAYLSFKKIAKKKKE